MASYVRCSFHRCPWPVYAKLFRNLLPMESSTLKIIRVPIAYFGTRKPVKSVFSRDSSNKNVQAEIFGILYFLHLLVLYFNSLSIRAQPHAPPRCAYILIQKQEKSKCFFKKMTIFYMTSNHYAVFESDSSSAHRQFGLFTFKTTPNQYYHKARSRSRKGSGKNVIPQRYFTTK